MAEIGGVDVPEAHQISPDLAAVIAAEYAYLAQYWPQNLPHGVIHADLFPDNVFFIDGIYSGVIDFYFACNDFFAYELAVLLNSWCFDFPDFSFNAENARALIAGYQTLRPLPPIETENMIILARGAALRFLLTRLYDWINHPPGALVERKDPREYQAKLQFFQQARLDQIFG